MKKLLLNLFAALIILSSAKATTYTVTVSNFQFSPSTVNAIVGDTITWVYVNGKHTTTSLTIPAGAASWSAPMQQAGATFTYVLTEKGTYNYWCAIHTTEMEAVINVSASLAVNFNAFTVSSVAGNKALISWQALTTANTAYYSVRRSYDGNNFSEIAKVTATTGSTAKTYQYTDASFNTNNRYIYYSIAIVNKDGSTQLSSIKMFQNSASAPKLITSLGPNPVTGGHLMLQFNADKAGQMLVRISDAAGKVVLSTPMTAVQGINNGHLHLGNLPQGSYNITFILNEVKGKS